MALADAFLALTDDDVAVDQRSRPRILAAACAAAALALGAPAGYLSAHPSDHPVGALSSKLSFGVDDE